MEKPDVLIIGGGVIGISSAYYLARDGVSVTLLEKGEIGRGSSWANAGLIVPCFSTPIPAPGQLAQAFRWMLDPESPFYIQPRFNWELFSWLWKFRSFCNEQAVHRAIPLLRDLQRASLALFETVIAEEQIACRFEKRGGLELFRTERRFEDGLREADEMAAYGLDMTAMKGDAVRELEPAAHLNVVGGILYQEDAHLEPAEFILGLAAAAQRHGAHLETRTEVQGITRSGSRITRVHTHQREYQPKQVVLAAGAWSTQIGHQFDLRFPMEPAKGYSLTMKAPVNGPQVPLHLAEARMAVTPLGHQLRFAGTLELAGFDTRINQRRVKAIHRNALEYLVEMGPLEIEEPWAGLRPVSPDGLPYIGRSRTYPNLILATGHAMQGVSMGPITGQLVADLISDRKPGIDIAGLAVDRFA